MTHTLTRPNRQLCHLDYSLHTLYRVELVGGDTNARTQLSLKLRGSQLLGGEAVQGQIWNKLNFKSGNDKPGIHVRYVLYG